MSIESQQVPTTEGEIPASPGSSGSPSQPVSTEAGSKTADVDVTADVAASQKEAAGPAGGSVPDQPSSGDILALLAAVEQRILDAFEQKLAYDASKEKQVDRLHEELQ